MMSQRLNEVMKVLTIFATIMLPLTFIAGVYGMNFDYLPELHWKYGYFVVWGVMLAVAAGLLLFFRRRGWL
jgi:magnesium transporter